MVALPLAPISAPQNPLNNIVHCSEHATPLTRTQAPLRTPLSQASKPSFIAFPAHQRQAENALVVNDKIKNKNMGNIVL